MDRIGEAGSARRFDGHRRAFAEGADRTRSALPVARGKLVQQPAVFDILGEVADRAREATRDRAVALRARFFRADRPAAMSVRPTQSPARARASAPSRAGAISSCARPCRMLAGTATSIIFGLGRFSAVISATYSSTQPTCRRGLQRLLLADGDDRVALVVVRGKHQRVLGQPQQPCEDQFVLRRADRRSGNRCARCRGSAACRR